MKLETFNFAVRAGDTGAVHNEAGLEVVIKAGSPPAPVALGDDVLVFTCATALGADPLFTKTSTDGGVTVAPEDGFVRVPFTSVNTLAMLAAVAETGRPLVYALKRLRGAAIKTELTGEITVIEVPRHA